MSFNNLNKINIFNYLDKYLDEQVICLGFFDCIHLGHLKLFNKAKLLSHKYGFKTSVFTFNNNPLKYFSDQKLIYTFEERIKVFEELSIDNVFYATFDKSFSSMNKKEFLDNLCANKNIRAIVCGEDYTFGFKKEGNIEYLKEYCIEHQIELYVENLRLSNNEKISTKNIRKDLINGKIENANKLLSSPYFISGVVKKGKGIGSKDVYPTANIEINDEKLSISHGEYYTLVEINGVKFRAVTNVGNKPTLDDYKDNIESYILFYNKSLYGKEIKIEFIKKIRDTQKFNSLKELREQISKDIEFALK